LVLTTLRTLVNHFSAQVRQDRGVRIYIPATLNLLHQWRDAGQIPSDVTAYAVTAAVIEAFPNEEEEQEYAASLLAADESVVLLAADAQAAKRRTVVAVDAAATVVDQAEVSISDPIAWEKVASLLVDDASASGAVADAIETGAPDLLDDFALLWFAADELDEL